MDAIRKPCFASVSGYLLDEGSMDFHSRDMSFSERLRQSKGRTAVSNAQVQNLSNGIAARNRLKCAECRSVVSGSPLRQGRENLVDGVVHVHVPFAV